MSSSKKAANAGIDALLGFEFQRNCALFLLLNDYENFKEKEFFLCIEHHDDFLFCYRTNCRTEIKKVLSYQAKKLTGSVWTINKRFKELIAKILEVGNNLNKDPSPKSKNYTHELTFISNTDIKLAFNPNVKEKKSGKRGIIHLINEQNSKNSFKSLPEDIKSKIDKDVNSYCKKETLIFHKTEIDNLHIEWVDLSRNKKTQKATLVGLMKINFPHVLDSLAAVELLLSLFRDVEAIYNQGKIITLLDSSKRVEGSDIKHALNVIETKQKTFDLWRKHSNELSRQFKIPIGIQTDYENHIKNTFELLKDMNNHSHQLIKKFVRENDFSMDFYSHNEMFKAYVIKIKDKNNMNLKDIDIFFASLCAFVEYFGENLK